MSDQQWSVSEHVGPAGLAGVEADWRRLYEEMPNPAMWHSFEAHSVYVDHLCPDADAFRCLALSDGDHVRAILPLEERLERGLGVPFRIWGMPLRNGWRLSDAIGPEDEARRALLPAVIEYLRCRPGRPAILSLGRTADTSLLWHGLDALSAGTRLVFNDGAEYVVATDVSVEEFLAGMSGKSRSKISKRARQFEALADATYVRATTNEELLAEYDDLLRVEASGWKGERGTAIEQHPALVAFYRGLIDRFVTDGHCEIHSMHAEGACIANEFCVYTRRQVDALKGAYDEQYARIAPGRLMTHKTLEWSCADPDIDVVSEISDAPWLRQWHPRSNELLLGYVALRPASGRLLVAMLRFRYGPARDVVRAWKAWRRSHEKTEGIHRGRDAG